MTVITGRPFVTTSIQTNAIRKSHVRAMRHICTDKLTSGNELYTLVVLKALWKSVKSSTKTTTTTATSRQGLFESNLSMAVCLYEHTDVSGYVHTYLCTFSARLK